MRAFAMARGFAVALLMVGLLVACGGHTTGTLPALSSTAPSGCSSALAIAPASQTAGSPGATVSFTISETSPTAPCAFNITDSAGHLATAYATGN